MSERDPNPAGPRQEAPAQRRDDPTADTTPGLRPAGGTTYSGAGASVADAGGGAVTGEGREGTGAHGHQEQGENYYTAPQYSTSPVTVRRPDPLAALLLLLAGIAAGVSLLLDWVSGSTGWDLVEDGFADFDAGSWQPPVIVLAGGALLVLGLLMFLPGRSHKTLGVLALLATLPALVGVAVVLNLSDFDPDVFEAGFWVAAAVPVLGLLGSLKAMLTGPRAR